MRKNIYTPQDIAYINNELRNFCSKMENTVNSCLGYVKASKNLIDQNISIKDKNNTRNYMSIKYNVGFKEEMGGIFSLVIDITPLGVLLRDEERFLPLSTRERRCQVDPCLYMHSKFYSYLEHNNFAYGPGYKLILKEFSKLKVKLQNDINNKYKKMAVYIGGITLRGHDYSIRPETTIEYHKLQCFYVDGTPFSKEAEKNHAEYAKKISNLNNFSVNMPVPGVSASLGNKSLALKYEAEVSNLTKKDIKTESKIDRKSIHKKWNSPLTKIANFFKRIGQSIYSLFVRTKDSHSDKANEGVLSKIFINNNVISVFLMLIPPLVYLVNIILLPIFGKEFGISLDGNWFWFNHAFKYRLCDMISANMEGANPLMMIVWIILIILSGILETVGGVIHLVLFIVTIIPAFIYAIGFQNAIGACVSAIIFPIVSLILNKITGHKIAGPITSLIINVILAGVYIGIAFAVLGI